MNHNRFITFEGIDGAGKSTHVEWFAERLRARGNEVVITREPGGTVLGEQLRELTLHHSMSAAAELLLIFAARAEHLEQLIRPALAAGKFVVCDRFTDSTYAYQGAGRQMGEARVAQLESLVHGDLQPGRTFLFDLDAAEAARRRARARDADRFESEDLEFFSRVRSAYRERASLAASRFVVVDGTRSIEEIRNLLEKYILKY